MFREPALAWQGQGLFEWMSLIRKTCAGGACPPQRNIRGRDRYRHRVRNKNVIFDPDAGSTNPACSRNLFFPMDTPPTGRRD